MGSWKRSYHGVSNTFLSVASWRNFVFSPVGMHSALSMLYLATKSGSVSREELGLAMGKLRGQEIITRSYQAILEAYADQTSLLLSNHIWVSNQFGIDKAYKALISK